MSGHKSKGTGESFRHTLTGKKLFELFYNFHLPLFSGILLILIQPPVSFFPLAFFALIPLLDSIKKDNLRFSFFAGYMAGIVSYFGLIYWVIIAMHRYGGIDIYLSFLILLLFVLYLSFYTGFFTLSCAWLERRLSIPVYLSAPLVWVLLEYVRGSLMSGFPWSFLAHSQYNFLPFIQVVSLTGSYFISFLIVAINALIYCLWRKQKPFMPYAVVIAILLAATLVYGFVSLTTKQEKPFSTAIVQGNIRQDVKWDETFKAMTIKKYLQMTLQDAKGTDLTIWPETAMPLLFDKEIYANKYIKGLPGLTNSLLLFGTMSQNKSGKFRNSSYMINKTGETIGVYSKVHLVPFGEYTPLLSYLPFFEKLTAAGGDFVSGEGHAPIKTDIGNIGILICYEGAFPSITNETVREGAQVLVNLTNDAWYEKTSAPFQHFAFYIFRAIETDRYMLRAANTGISAIIDPQGRIEAKTPIFVDAVLKGSFAMRNTKTFYVRYGDYFIVIALLGLAALVIAFRFRKSLKR
ncbi:MAG: apolipoprotein N-acyltransferase [Syntrophus sp. (in: bacteria)]|nr:apolipoprotein N-acyltransferase [Syntrophus sp. (in: bacteria)]